MAEVQQITLNEEDRIMRVWTPILLRTILIASAIVLVLASS
jgi:hypothetical protein